MHALCKKSRVSICHCQNISVVCGYVITVVEDRKGNNSKAEGGLQVTLQIVNGSACMKPGMTARDVSAGGRLLAATESKGRASPFPKPSLPLTGIIVQGFFVHLNPRPQSLEAFKAPLQAP